MYPAKVKTAYCFSFCYHLSTVRKNVCNVSSLQKLPAN